LGRTSIRRMLPGTGTLARVPWHGYGSCRGWLRSKPLPFAFRQIDGVLCVPLPCGRGSERAVGRYPVTAVLSVLRVLCVQGRCRLPLKPKSAIGFVPIRYPSHLSVLDTYVNFASLQAPQKRCKKRPKAHKNDQVPNKSDQKIARFALPILTFAAQIAPHGPETRIRTPKSAHLRVPATGHLT